MGLLLLVVERFAASHFVFQGFGCILGGVRGGSGQRPMSILSPNPAPLTCIPSGLSEKPGWVVSSSSSRPGGWSAPLLLGKTLPKQGRVP